MTTAQTQTALAPAVVIDDVDPIDGFRGYILIPLAEFGQSLDSASLDEWFEGFAERNKDAVGDFEITAQGELKIMPPTGFPGEWFETEMVIAVGVWSHGYGGRAGGLHVAFLAGRRFSTRTGCLLVLLGALEHSANGVPHATFCQVHARFCC